MGDLGRIYENSCKKILQFPCVLEFFEDLLLHDIIRTLKNIGNGKN